ncbi:MAG: DUF2007 domain-containing protein [Clostridiales bacterium]|nr:DUF2007 domain-containing protein [Clostridiales bacterium]
MWTIVYIAHSKNRAQVLKKRLEEEGIMVQLRVAGLAGAEDAVQNYIELLVPELEAEDATEIIQAALGGHFPS